MFLYLDPPYHIKSNLYGNKGSTHKGFDHQALFELIKDRPNWVLSYNNDEYIRELYQDFPLIDAKWAYGIRNKYQSAELLIFPKKS